MATRLCEESLDNYIALTMKTPVYGELSGNLNTLGGYWVRSHFSSVSLVARNQLP